jgi:hypothetical protein
LGSLEDPEIRNSVTDMTVGDLLALLHQPRVVRERSDRYRALDNVSANGRRLIPPKVTFSGIRTR